ncbi:MAG: dockerin type I domain-containing protein, partial [Planctomycetota bacterium]
PELEDGPITYVDLGWTDDGVASLDDSTFDASDIAIEGITIDRAETLGDGVIRYHFAENQSVSSGPVEVTWAAGNAADTAGNASEAGSATIESLNPPMAMRVFGRQFNRTTSTWAFNAFIVNTSQDTLTYPMRLLLSNLGPDGTEAANADGTLADGTPYIDLPGDGTMRPGAHTRSVTIAIKVPQRTGYHFDPVLQSVATDSGGTIETAAVSRSLAVEDGEPLSFQNPENRFDVNRDGKVTALDALLVINHLNRDDDLIDEATATLMGLRASGNVDVNGDGKASALDALQVINSLNRGTLASGQPEGEASPNPSVASQASESPLARASADDEEEPWSVEEAFRTGIDWLNE